MNPDVKIDPFPHLVVDDFLPEWVYADIADRWPPRSRFVAVKDGKWHIQKRREQDRLMAGCAGWQWFTQYIENQYASFLFNEFPFFDPAIIEHTRIELSLLVPKGQVFPHADIHKKICSAVLFFTDERAEGALELLRPIIDGNEHSWDAFETAVKIESIPNRLAIFQKNDHSWHGVRSVRFSRRTITITLMKSDG